MHILTTGKIPFFIRIALYAAVITAVFCLCGVALATEEDWETVPEEVDEADLSLYPDSNGPDYTMSPGETYDVSTASNNTSVYISSPGKYYLKGTSTKCRVVINSSDVYLYLKDGLHLDPGIKANDAKSTAAISIDDNAGGTVHIVSEKNAYIYLGGYLHCPAIRKEGNNTKLIFETEDPDNPGTIEAYRSFSSLAAAIGGSYVTLTYGYSSGKVEFKSGNIIATGGRDAAAIGTSASNTYMENYTFSGANVTATSYGYGAAIGSALNGFVRNLKITGGTINAACKRTGSGPFGTAGRGAGIGCGSDNGGGATRCESLTITGGDITAYSHWGSAIGGGYAANVDKITITGGNINATADNFTAIGASGQDGGGRCSNLTITGGNITAVGDSVGLGSGTGHSGNTTINISGGVIHATGGTFDIGGGGIGLGLTNTGACFVNISGGTIVCDEAFDTSKGRIGSDYHMTCTITGGSVKVHKIDNKPVNGDNERIYQTDVKVYNGGKEELVTAAEISGVAGNTIGIHDMYILHQDGEAYGHLYLWLPESASTETVTASGQIYVGSSVTSSTLSKSVGALYPVTSLILDVNTTASGATNGSGYTGKGDSKVRQLVNAAYPGYTLKGYGISKTESNDILLNADGTFNKNKSGYTDSDGKWLKTGGTVTLYAYFSAHAFHVRFDANVPPTASTAMSGTMSNQSFVYGTAQALTANTFELPGYIFTGWNTKADGTGQSLADKADGSKLTQKDGAEVVLYAQWTPITYTISFSANGGSGSMATQKCTFDVPLQLPANTFTKSGYVFTGWTRRLSVGSLYADGQTVENLVSIQDAAIIFEANWAQASKLMIAVMLDNTPVTECEIVLTKDGVEYSGMFPYDPSSSLYYYNGTELPVGQYTVTLNGTDTGRTVEVEDAAKPVLNRFDYFSIGATADGQCDVEIAAYDEVVNATPKKALLTAVSPAVVTAPGKAVKFGSVYAWPSGGKFVITATNIKEGYHFSVWAATGIDPAYTESTTANNNPAIISVQGKTLMKAVTGVNAYTVRFEPNVPAGSSSAVKGTMEEQEFTFGTAQNLLSCGYTLEGYIYQGWNTQPDGTGTSYADSVEVNNLTSDNGATVSLYAQWKPITYTIRFNGNGGEGTMGNLVLTYDVPVTLPANLFTMEDWHFTGWAYEWSADSPAFLDGQEVVNLSAKDGDTFTLFAQWSHDVYTVRYEANDGSGLCYEDEAWTHISYTVINSPFTRDGYTFAGWTTVPNSSSDIYYPSDDFIDPVEAGETFTLYARWKKGIPQTGDENTPLLWAGLMLTAGAGLVTVRLTRKRKRKR